MQVKLFAHPCVMAVAPHFAHSGHASHVTCARWLADGAHVVSTGGKDRAVFLWRAVPAAPPQTPAAALQPPWAPDPGDDAGRFWAAKAVPRATPVPEVHAVAHDPPRKGCWK